MSFGGCTLHSPLPFRKGRGCKFPTLRVFGCRNAFSWYGKIENRVIVQRFEDEVLTAMRNGQEAEGFIDYGSVVRNTPVERRFPGVDRIAKLRSVKEKWDPEGIFTRESL